MKYKILGISMALLMLAAAVLATAYKPGEGVGRRIHQHLTARPDTGCDCDGTELCSHLPLVVINTGGQEIPGEPTGILDSFGQNTFTVAADGNPMIKVELAVIDNQEGNNHPSDTPAFTTSSMLRIRGNSSRHFAKKPYLLKFVDDQGLDNDIAVMGMDAHHEWVLNGPYLDKSLVRNYMWYNIAGEIMDYAPNVRFCEVIIDGEYCGLYLMVESITNGNDCRLNLRKSAQNSELLGYLLRIDRTTEADFMSMRDIYTFTERIARVNSDIAIRYPGKTNLTPELAEEIEMDFAAFEKALYSYDHDTWDYGYWHWIDVDNFVDYYIINEFTANVDVGRYSTYIYKEPGGKYRLCVWDFNNACDNYAEDKLNTNGFETVDRVFYFMLFKDEEFVQQIINRYKRLRQSYLSDEYLLNYIDETLAWLGPAVERNNQRWAEAMSDTTLLEPAERNLASHEEGVEQLKNWLLNRGEWMDENIDVLQNYAHPFRNKRYNH